MKEFIGRWRITAMDIWDQDYVDLVEPGFFEFGPDGIGSFVFGAVRGWLDVKVLDGESRLEYTWQGDCEGDDMSGRGWFEFQGGRQVDGMLFVHAGDESGVTIERET